MFTSGGQQTDCFPIPLGSSVTETLDLGLSLIEDLVNRAWIHEHRNEPGTFQQLAAKTLSEKVEDLFPDGYGYEEDDYDRCFWPDVATLDCLRETITPETAISAADQWLIQSGNLDGATPDNMSSYPESGPLRTEMVMATMVGCLCIYVEAWVEGWCEPD